MTVVIDATTVVAALTGDGATAEWAESELRRNPLAAPHLLPVEVASVLRRSVVAGQFSIDVATLAHDELLDLPIELHPYEPVAQRAWELRGNVSAYDAWYVALAEFLDAPLVTMDARLARASGPRCEFRAPGLP